MNAFEKKFTLYALLKLKQKHLEINYNFKRYFDKST